MYGFDTWEEYQEWLHNRPLSARERKQARDNEECIEEEQNLTNEEEQG